MEEINEIKVSKKQIILDLQAKISTLEADLKKQTEYKELYQKRESEYCAQIEELHDFLDGLPNVMPKDKERGYGTNKPQTRLLSWIATKVSL